MKKIHVILAATALSFMISLPANALHNDPGWNDHTPKQQRAADRHEKQVKRRMIRNLKKNNRDAKRAERKSNRR